MSKIFKVVSPIDGSVYVERPLATMKDANAALKKAAAAQKEWAAVSLADRARICTRFVDAFLSMQDTIVPELAWQMGRPIACGSGEISGFQDRAQTMIALAEEALTPIRPDPIHGFNRYIKRTPLGVIFIIAAWNYPYLIAVNSLVPALMAGNSVVLKHSSQTPLCAERLGVAFEKAGGPADLLQVLHINHDTTAQMVAHPLVSHVVFTGSVAGGAAIERAAAGRFIGVGLELGGKDPAYVCADADIPHAVDNLVDGAFFNSGQSCCGKERLYVNEDIYDTFLEGFVERTRQYILGNPLEESTSLGPLVRTGAADFVRGQIKDAVRAGARALIQGEGFSSAREGTPYLAPEVLIDVDHTMRIMTEETFGPAIGIMKVRSDEEAIQLMNDSSFGLTASIWSTDEEAAQAIGDQVETGTLFLNRCDYLDPDLTWTGTKNSGRGCALSTLGYEHLTRPKSYHLRTVL